MLPWNKNTVENVGISLDKFAGSLILSGITLLFLPDRFLVSWQTALYLSLLLCPLILLAGRLSCHKTKYSLLWLLFFTLNLAYVHQSAIQLLNQADNIARLPKIIHIEFTVDEILHQQQYQTLVIRAKLADNLPEQRLYTNWKLKQNVNIGERYVGD